jgi:hypothetical protein
MQIQASLKRDAWQLSAAKSGDGIALVELSTPHSDMTPRKIFRIAKNCQDSVCCNTSRFWCSRGHAPGGLLAIASCPCRLIRLSSESAVGNLMSSQ